jgi:geranylgeranyl diphosphate synthase type II
MEEVAHAAGTVNGMVGGQVADLEATAAPADASAVEYIHRAKTGAMIRVAVRAGAIYAGAGEAELAHLTRYGENIGFAFQIMDDILDVESSSAALGKTAGKDQTQHKATFPAVHGLERSREMAAGLVGRACEELQVFGARGERLRQLAEFLASRKS